MTKAEREALEALADKWATDRNWSGDCVEELRALLATLDKPATRYPLADAPEWAMWAATGWDGIAFWYDYEPDRTPHGWRPLGKNWHSVGRRMPMSKWPDSLERRPDAP